MGTPVSKSLQSTRPKEYQYEEWAKTHFSNIRNKISCEKRSSVKGSTVEYKGNQLNFTLISHLKEPLEASLQFFEGGIVKMKCRNPRHTSNFSFEDIEAPENLRPYDITNSVNVDSDRVLVNYLIAHNAGLTLVLTFQPSPSRLSTTPRAIHSSNSTLRRP
jgi:hypothetical protein